MSTRISDLLIHFWAFPVAANSELPPELIATLLLVQGIHIRSITSKWFVFLVSCRSLPKV